MLWTISGFAYIPLSSLSFLLELLLLNLWGISNYTCTFAKYFPLDIDITRLNLINLVAMTSRRTRTETILDN